VYVFWCFFLVPVNGSLFEEIDTLTLDIMNAIQTEPNVFYICEPDLSVQADGGTNYISLVYNMLC
jgi:hypothetical protein